MKRRELLQLLQTLPLSTTLISQSLNAKVQNDVADPWARAKEITLRLQKPLEFKNTTYNIVNFGASPCNLREVEAQISHNDLGKLMTPTDDAPDCREAITTAIDRCNQTGGGKVIVPGGNWYCAGPIILKSNVHLHLETGAHIYFSTSPQDYAKFGEFDCGANGKLSLTRWQGNDCLNFTSMIYARGQHNFALTGADWTSVLDGQGGVPFKNAGKECWWSWKSGSTHSSKDNTMDASVVNPSNEFTFIDLAKNIDGKLRQAIAGNDRKWLADEYFLPSLSEANVDKFKRVFGLGHYLRPSMINLVNCSRVHLSGYQVTNTPFWQHHPIDCKELYIHDVYCNSLGPNSDGFDPESCDHVLVERCTFDTGDDCIAIKAGKNLDTKLGPSQNIVIQDCVMQSGHGGVTLGSEMAAGIKNVYVQDIVMENKNWRTNPLNTAIRLKTNMNRGGYLKDFYVRRVSIPNGVKTVPSFYKSFPDSPISSKTVPTEAGAIITFDCDYSSTKDNIRSRPPVVSNIQISDVTAGNVMTPKGEFSCYQPIVILGPVKASYNGSDVKKEIFSVSNVTIKNCDFGKPASGDEKFFMHNVENLNLVNVTINGKKINKTIQKFI